MGRTNGTYRQRLRPFEEEWQPFRRALRQPHQEPFDDLIEKADRFAAASGTQNPVHIYRTNLLSMVLAQEIERQQLEDRIAALEAEVGDAV